MLHEIDFLLVTDLSCLIETSNIEAMKYFFNNNKNDGYVDHQI